MSTFNLDSRYLSYKTVSYTHNFDVLSPSVSKWQLCIHTSLCTQVFSTHLPDHHRFLSICVSKSISLAYVYSLCIVTLRTYVVLFNYCMIDHAQGPITSPCPGIHLCMIDLIIVCCLGFLYCRKEHISLNDGSLRLVGTWITSDQYKGLVSIIKAIKFEDPELKKVYKLQPKKML